MSSLGMIWTSESYLTTAAVGWSRLSTDLWLSSKHQLYYHSNLYVKHRLQRVIRTLCLERIQIELFEKSLVILLATRLQKWKVSFSHVQHQGKKAKAETLAVWMDL